MRKNQFLIVFVLLIVTSVFIPLLLNDSAEDAIHIIDHISFIIAAVCGVITTLLAIILYDKYGVDKTILEKNIDTVLKIVEELKNTNVYVRSEGDSHCYAYFLNLWDADIANDPFYKLEYKDPIYFKLSYAWDFGNLSSLRKSPFVPKEIAESIKSIQILTTCDVSKKDLPKEYAVISTKVNDSIEKEAICKFNGRDMILDDYVNLISSIRDTIKLWLVNHNVDSNSLNF